MIGRPAAPCLEVDQAINAPGLNAGRNDKLWKTSMTATTRYRHRRRLRDDVTATR
jgi:hypothetical protein